MKRKLLFTFVLALIVAKTIADEPNYTTQAEKDNDLAFVNKQLAQLEEDYNNPSYASYHNAQIYQQIQSGKQFRTQIQNAPIRGGSSGGGSGCGSGSAPTPALSTTPPRPPTPGEQLQSDSSDALAAMNQANGEAPRHYQGESDAPSSNSSRSTTNQKQAIESQIKNLDDQCDQSCGVLIVQSQKDEQEGFNSLPITESTIAEQILQESTLEQSSPSEGETPTIRNQPSVETVSTDPVPTDEHPKPSAELGAAQPFSSPSEIDRMIHSPFQEEFPSNPDLPANGLLDNEKMPATLDEALSPEVGPMFNQTLDGAISDSPTTLDVVRQVPTVPPISTGDHSVDLAITDTTKMTLGGKIEDGELSSFSVRISNGASSLTYTKTYNDFGENDSTSIAYGYGVFDIKGTNNYNDDGNIESSTLQAGVSTKLPLRTTVEANVSATLAPNSDDMSIGSVSFHAGVTFMKGLLPEFSINAAYKVLLPDAAEIIENHRMLNAAAGFNH